MVLVGSLLRAAVDGSPTTLDLAMAIARHIKADSLPEWNDLQASSSDAKFAWQRSWSDRFAKSGCRVHWQGLGQHCSTDNTGH